MYLKSWLSSSPLNRACLTFANEGRIALNCCVVHGKLIHAEGECNACQWDFSVWIEKCVLFKYIFVAKFRLKWTGNCIPEALVSLPVSIVSISKDTPRRVNIKKIISALHQMSRLHQLCDTDGVKIMTVAHHKFTHFGVAWCFPDETFHQDFPLNYPSKY